MRIAAIIGGWLVLFLAVIFAYLPGINGPFVVDDFGSIERLGNLGGVNSWATFHAFVFGGEAGPTGRPISLLTFLIDANNWPADSWPFKRTNLIIHLINAALLGFLTHRILRLLDFKNQDVHWMALVAAACWALHPFLVSTTLYVVQRMAQLSTLFVFTGLIGHLYGRSILATNALKAYLIMSLSVVLFTLLAMLSKENGVLLPLLIGVTEFTVLASQRDRLNRLWAGAFIVVPSLVIVAFLGIRAFTNEFFHIVPPRDFSIYERMLTEPRILADYLQNWFVPKLYTTGVFQDHFIKSSGILSPITTALSVLLHIAIISIAVVNRRKWPVFALAALFFYSGHLLESSVLNLELYFEHRNYLPACFLFLPGIVFLRQKARRHLSVVLVVGMLMLLGGFTRYSATVWADFSSIVEASARKAPTSARAQADYAKDLFNVGRYEEALRVIDQAIAVIPVRKPQLLVNRLTMLCKLEILDTDEFERAAKALSDTVYDPRLISIYNEFVSTAVNQQCGGVSLVALRDLFVNMLKVPVNADVRSQRYSQIKYFIGLVAAYDEEPLQAVTAFEESLQAEPSAKSAMNMAALLATNNYFQEALDFSTLALEELENSPRNILSVRGVSEADIRNFQAVVRADMVRVPDGDTLRPTP